MGGVPVNCFSDNVKIQSCSQLKHFASVPLNYFAKGSYIRFIKVLPIALAPSEFPQFRCKIAVIQMFFVKFRGKD